MREIPTFVEAKGWTWQQFRTPTFPAKDFWLGTDAEGNRWLTKLRGPFYAYREIVFARVVQSLGWSCQSSMFLRLDKDSANFLGRKAGEVHAAHWFLMEHTSTECREDCPTKRLREADVLRIEDLVVAGVSHLIDWPKSELAAYIFGGNETPGRLVTIDHKFVIIDSEQMFSTGPVTFSESHWLKNPDGTASLSGNELAIEVCSEIASLKPSSLSEALTTPPGLRLKLEWPIKPKLTASIEFAKNYLQSLG